MIGCILLLCGGGIMLTFASIAETFYSEGEAGGGLFLLSQACWMAAVALK